jgi:hypothetical protein
MSKKIDTKRIEDEEMTVRLSPLVMQELAAALDAKAARK